MINVIDINMDLIDSGVVKSYEFIPESISYKIVPEKLGEIDLKLSDGDIIYYDEFKIIITYTDGIKQTINKSWFL